MRKSIIAASILVGMTLAASAGTELQLQFKRWAYEGNGAVTLMVAMRNPTAKPFATVVWSCDFYDKDHRVVGHSPLIFHVVPWGAVVVDTQYVYSNGMFQSGSCQLVSTEAATCDNERLYRGGPPAQPGQRQPDGASVLLLRAANSGSRRSGLEGGRG